MTIDVIVHDKRSNLKKNRESGEKLRHKLRARFGKRETIKESIWEVPDMKVTHRIGMSQWL